MWLDKDSTQHPTSRPYRGPGAPRQPACTAWCMSMVRPLCAVIGAVAVGRAVPCPAVGIVRPTDGLGVAAGGALGRGRCVAFPVLVHAVHLVRPLVLVVHQQQRLQCASAPCTASAAVAPCEPCAAPHTASPPSRGCTSPGPFARGTSCRPAASCGFAERPRPPRGASCRQCSRAQCPP